MAPFHPQMELATFRAAAGGGGGGTAPALPTLTSTGQTPIFRLYSDAPTNHLYQDDALTIQAANNLDPVFGIKDISGAGNNFADTLAGHGGFISTAAINGKRAIDFNGSTLIESDNSANVNIVRTAAYTALLAVLKVEDVTGSPRIAMGSTKSKPADYDAYQLRFAGSGSHILGGRWGANGSGDSTQNAIGSSALQASWADFSNKTIKLVLRTAYGSGNVQRLDIAVTDGTLSGVGSTSYTNTSLENDSAALAWDYFTLGGYYLSGGAQPSVGGWLAEVVMWMGTSQMNDTDVAALLSYAAGTAGF